MEPSSPNDLAFFYLYDYTSPPRPSTHRRTHRRHASSTPSPSAHLEKATHLRSLHIEAKRTKLATHNTQIAHVLAQYKLSPPTNQLQSILDRMARAVQNRETKLRLMAEAAGKRVEEAKRTARRVKRERDEAKRTASKEILERLESAERRRGELLSARGRASKGGFPTRKVVVDEQTKVEAATKIQLFWRRGRILRAVREFQGFNVSVESVTQHSFEQVVAKFKSASTVRATARLLTVLGLITHETPEKETDSLVRTFLSAYMVLGHTTEVLHSHTQPMELVMPSPPLLSNIQDLVSKAKFFLTILESHIRTLYPAPSLPTLWHSYLSAFRAWKSHDSSILVEMLVNKFVDLDLMLLDIQESSTMDAVLEEYTEGIKSGQVLLLSKIRRLAGDETRNIVRRAVQVGRRRRSQMAPQPIVAALREEEIEGTAQVELVDPPSMNGLTNRRIMHELAINPEYEITPPKKTDERRQREEMFQKAYYTTLETALRNDDQSLLPTVVHDIKSCLLSLLQPSTPSYTALSEHLDNTIVQQQCQHGLFDSKSFLEYVINMMRQLCAPARDGDVTAISSGSGSDQIDTFILQLKQVNEVLGMMALDSANFHLHLARPALIAQATNYERTKFADELASGTVSLDKTSHWLVSATQLSLSNSREGETLSPIQIFRWAFIDLLFSTDEVPETFDFDVHRINTLRTDIKSVISLAALLLVARTFTAGANSRPVHWHILASRLSVLQHDSPENILVEIDRFISSATINRTLLLSMIRRVKGGDKDPMVSLLNRRFKAILMNVLGGGEVGALNGAGLGEVAKEVGEIGKGVGMLGKVNWGVYRAWYEDIINKALG